MYYDINIFISIILKVFILKYIFIIYKILNDVEKHKNYHKNMGGLHKVKEDSHQNSWNVYPSSMNNGGSYKTLYFIFPNWGRRCCTLFIYF